MAANHTNGDTLWFAPGRKRPIATSTTATNDLIVMLAEAGHTVYSASSALNFDLIEA